MPEVALGTAQFGLNYGITNEYGQVPEDEVAMILQEAARVGITYLDTAQAYGKAETVLGKTLPRNHSFKIVTKLPKQESEKIDLQYLKKLEKDFHLSLQKLGVSKLEGFLLHSIDDIKRSDSGYLIDWLWSLQERGLVSYLGVSIYEASDLDNIYLDWIKLIQLPLSLYDQRLIHDKTIRYLKSRGILIHSRSIFLQGLIATPSHKWPLYLQHTSFMNHHKKAEQFAKEIGRSLLELAIDFSFSQSDVDCVLIGINSLNNLQEIINIKNNSVPIPFKSEMFLFNNLKYIDPRNWQPQ